MAEKVVLRCQFKGGQRKVLNGLTKDSSAVQLQEELFALTGVAPHRQRILFGFPPKELSISDGNMDICSLAIKSGDTLIVEENKCIPAVVEDSHFNVNENDTQAQNLEKNTHFTEKDDRLKRHVVPADNSCLFTSLSYLLHHGNTSLSTEVRSIAAQCILSDPATFNEAVLGKPNAEYCEWILNPDHWGGAIEITALSKYFQVEIDVVDIQSGRIDRFGQDEVYLNRVFLIYDGIHYDPLSRETNGSPQASVRTIFPMSDSSTYAEAMALSKEAREKRQFTDLGGFSLRCLTCQTTLVGQNDAQNHAKSTGHTNFGEL